MTFGRSVWERLTESWRDIVTDANQAVAPMPPIKDLAAEVDNMQERYSARKYIAHLQAAMAGDRTGHAEWARYILGLSMEDHRVFYWEVDKLIEDGELCAVLSPEEMAQVRQRVIEHADEYRALSDDDGEVPAAVMNELLSPDITPEREAELVEQYAVDDSDLEAWTEEEETNASPSV